MTDTPQTLASMPSGLPDSLPVIALEGVVLLPGARVPLNVAEPEHLVLIEDAMRKGRLVAMVQPMGSDKDGIASPLFQVGCAGRIVSFSETDDGRFLVQILGVCRFTVVQDTLEPDAVRRVKPDFQKYLGDLEPHEEMRFDRARLMEILRAYFKAQGIAADWNAVQNTTSDLLISSLIMICDFEPNEKQALMEAPDFASRAGLLIALLEMACLRQSETDEMRH